MTCQLGFDNRKNWEWERSQRGKEWAGEEKPVFSLSGQLVVISTIYFIIVLLALREFLT